MRASLEQVKAGLLHEDKEVRSLALRYFGRGSIGDESVTAMAMAAIERFGREEAFENLWPLAELPQTPESVDWAVRQLETYGLYDRRFGSAEIDTLLSANPQLTSPRRDEVLSIDGLEDIEAAQFKLRWEIESWPSERLWKEIRAICNEGKDRDCAADFRFLDAEWMIDVIGRRGGPFPDWGLAVLATPIPEDAWKGNPNEWMQPLLATLAGDLRHEPAVAALIAELHHDTEVGNRTSQAALVQIGSDDVVARILAEWRSAPLNFRLCALDILGWIRSDAAVGALIELFPRLDEDSVSQHITALMLVDAVSTEANEAVLRYIEERGYDNNVSLLRQITASSTLLGHEMPGLAERLARAIELQPRREHQFLRREIERFASRLSRLQSRQPAIELEQEEQLPPVDSFVIGPIRVTKTAGRNDPCPCGSGKKFKKCCWGREVDQETEVGTLQ